jgi:hypothetical protein
MWWYVLGKGEWSMNTEYKLIIKCWAKSTTTYDVYQSVNKYLVLTKEEFDVLHTADGQTTLNLIKLALNPWTTEICLTKEDKVES